MRRRWKKGRLSGFRGDEPLPDLEFDKIDLTVGSKFIIESTAYQVIVGQDCVDCGFVGALCPKVACDAEERSDGINVSFKVFEEKEE